MKDNKEFPLRVRLTAEENEQLKEGMRRTGLPKSEYVRWAIKNSTVQLLQPQVVAAAPEPAKPEPKKRARPRLVEAPQEPTPPEYFASAPVEAVPDVLTAMGLAQPQASGPQPLYYDDSDWT